MTTGSINPDTIGFLFDLDGVIIDSESEYTRIWHAIDQKFPTGVENFEYVIKGRTLTEILDTFFPDRDTHPKVTDMLNEMEQKMRYRFLPGAKEFIESLIDKDFPRVMVTSSNDLKMARLREEIPDLEGMFTDIVTADRISRSKPDPEGYLLGAELCGASPERCFVFEDSRQGVMAGRNAGAFVVGLTTTLPEIMISEFCDITIGNLSETNPDTLIRQLNHRRS